MRPSVRAATCSIEFEVLEARIVLTDAPIISEFMASNDGGLKDQDGEASDWIEIYNPNPEALDLTGWSLTDKASDLDQWTFSQTTIPGNQFLVVFASGKDRIVGPELHTNFKLSAEGEFLALVDPSGIVASQYSPKFPPQVTNVSYGVEFETAKFVQPGSALETTIPVDGSLGTSWTTTSYVAQDWTTGTNGVGYGILQPGFNVTYIKSNLFVDDLGIARQVAADPATWANVVEENRPVFNYLGNGGGANFGDDYPFPSQTIGDDIDDFVVQANAILQIPTAGAWSFDVNSDDGFELRLERNGIVFTSEYYYPRAPGDTVATFYFPEEGSWNLSLIIYERGGGASVELSAAPGEYQYFDPNAFRLIGDTAAGGLEAFAHLGGGSDGVVGTNNQAEMQNLNASAFIRIPFEVADPLSFEALILKMRYDDGFVAYFNGVEVLRKNAPDLVAFDSAATSKRSLDAAMTSETFNLTGSLHLLRSGNNVLAIQGLNYTADDESFLILPELTASSFNLRLQRYFETATPDEPNSQPSLGIVSRVEANVPAGFYSTPVTVSLSTPSLGATIRYTTDGSDPSEQNGQVYSGPITLASTTTLRAQAYQDGYISLPSITRTYLFLDDVIHQSPSDDVDEGNPELGVAPSGWPTNWGNNVVDYGIDQTIVEQEGAAQMKAALLAIPSISITTDLSNLFDPVTGIYANAYNDGRDWERPASVELLNPDGSTGFQINAGLRVRGGFSRSGDNPKHAFRVFFRNDYGESTLEYPLFGTEGADSFKKLDLRTAQNYSWSFGGDPNNTMIQDVFTRESQGAMGEAYARSQWYHLYIDGQYWGIYQSEERPEAEYAATYFGGSAENYDVIKPEAGPYINYATDGDLNAYNYLWELSTTLDFTSNANYFHLQGKDANGIDDPSIPNEDVLVDVENLITYMIGILHGGNLDAPISAFLGNEGINNYFAIRDRTGREGFKFIQHDAEHTLLNIYEDRNGPFPAGEQVERFNPQFLHQKLMANAEYRLKFADAVQKNFFGDGPMTVEQSQARFQKHVDQLNLAIIAESARWGDAKRPTSPLGRSDWLAAVDRMLNGFLGNRNPILLDQLRANGLFSGLDAPLFLINGTPQGDGQTEPGSILQFSASEGIVYFTTDGSDPRLVGGGINPDAMAYDPSINASTLIPAGSEWKYDDQGVDLGSAWKETAFADSSWSTGWAQLGYGDGDETTTTGFGPDASAKYITTYFRKEFIVSDPANVTGVLLRMVRDDGAIVYINGVEVARSNMPSGNVDFQTPASAAIGGADESAFVEYLLPANLVMNGQNVIAVEVHQSSSTSSDISFVAELVAFSQIDPGFVLNRTSHLMARVFNGVDWSPLSEGEFSILVPPAAAGNLAVTEIHYNPVAQSGSSAAPFNDKENFEFIELRNTSSHAIDLSGVRFISGIEFDFSSGNVTTLEQGQTLVVVKNRQAFEFRYGTNVLVAGVYSGNLSNGGERIQLVDSQGVTIQDFSYDDEQTTNPKWPAAADGGGYSLTVRSLSGAYSSPSNWRASYLIHGTPGYEENDFPTNLTLSQSTVTENVPNAFVGNVSAVDPNSTDVITFSILPVLDGGQFILNGNKLYVGEAGLDYEAGSKRSLVIRATDLAGLWTESAFEITVLDISENVLPQIQDQSFEIAENAALGTIVGTVIASDTDPGDSLLFSIVEGNVDNSFHVDALTGIITVANSGHLDFETSPKFTLTVQVDDGHGGTATALISIVVTDLDESSNSSPVLEGTRNLTFIEASAERIISPALQIYDADSLALSSAMVRIVSNYQPNEDELGFVPDATTGDISGAFDIITGTLTLTPADGSATVAEFRAALRLVTYVNTSANPDTAVRSVEYLVSDGSTTSNSVNSQVTVVAVNNAPQIVGTNSVAYTEAQSPILINPSLTVSDADNATLAWATVRVDTTEYTTQDVLGFVGDSTTGNITASFYARTLTLTSADSTATVAQFQAALRRVTYFNTSSNPLLSDRTVTYRILDGSLLSSSVASTVTITPVNNPPKLAVSSTLMVSANQAAKAINPSILVSDVDSPGLTSATVQISANYVMGEDVLSFAGTAATGDIAGSFDPTLGTLTLTSLNATVAQYQAALRLVTYRNTNSQPSYLPRAIEYQVTDGSLSSNSLLSLITINSGGLAPSLAGDSVVFYAEQQGPTPINPAIVVSDPDSEQLAWATVRIASQYAFHEDVLQFVGDQTTGNIMGSFNQPLGILTLFSPDATATVAQFQAALRRVTFHNVSSNPSTLDRSVRFEISDGSNVSQRLACKILFN